MNQLNAMSLTAAALRELDLVSLERLALLYGPGNVETSYAPTQGHWSPGDGRPLVAFEDDPAAAQAAGRCVAGRTRFADTFGQAIHPARCGWCDYPMPELLKALDHAAFHSRYIVTEYVWWPAKDGSYVRSTGRDGMYENPRWAAFFEMDRPLRAKAVKAASE